MKRWVWIPGGLLLSTICLVLWLIVAMDYGDNVAAGTYQFEGQGESSALVLNPDHTFRQTRRLGNQEQQAEGTWQRVGQGGVSFSKEFLVVSGDEPEPDGTTFSDMHKTAGVFVSLRIRQYHVLWYGKTSTGNSVPGTYAGDEPGVISTLTLNEDHSFSQTLTRNGLAKHATGTWSQDSDGTVRFSRDFLKTSGDPLSKDEIASSMAGANLQIVVSMAEHVKEPVFSKRFGLW